eukprot:scaffold261176_cov26-Tisochrysis_lutea.AAC.1
MPATGTMETFTNAHVHQHRPLQAHARSRCHGEDQITNACVHPHCGGTCVKWVCLYMHRGINIRLHVLVHAHISSSTAGVKWMRVQACCA